MEKGTIREFSKYRIGRIQAEEAYQFILKRHYARRIPSISFCFGLFRDREIVGILTIGKPASPSLCDGVCGKENSHRVYELNRLFLENGLPKNMGSYFISRCLGYLRPPPHQHEGFIIVSYADTDMNHCGYIYQSTNWIYTGITKERTDIGDEDGTHSRHYDKGLDYSKNRKHRSAKHRYVYFIGDRVFKRRMNQALKYQASEYPKTENKNYDTGSCEKQIYLWEE